MAGLFGVFELVLEFEELRMALGQTGDSSCEVRCGFSEFFERRGNPAAPRSAPADEYD